MTNKKKLIILTGPTAVGKTNLSIRIAKEIDAEIISADSMQVYKYMDIGSAKINENDMQGIKHHLIDFISPFDEFNVVRFQNEVKNAMKDIYSRGKIPMLVGGTGFYIQAILYDIDFKEEKTSDYREYLEKLVVEKGNGFLHDMLKNCDANAAERIHENDTKRVIRALEFNHDTGLKISEHNEAERNKESLYDFKYFVLNQPREILYKNIDLRVDKMLEDGLVDEVSALKNMGCTKDMVSMKGLGYKEILDYLSGNIDLDEAIRIIKRDTRHFAKRQLTWFKRERDCIWINKDEFNYDEDKILEYMLSLI